MCLECAKRKIAEEYEAYKKEVLCCNDAEVVWDLCNRIAFFSCVLEYFEFSETIVTLHYQNDILICVFDYFQV